MHRQSFTASSIRKVISSYDFDTKNYLKQKNSLDKAVSDAVERANQGFIGTLKFTKSLLRNKPVYNLSEYSDVLVTRKATDNVRYVYNVKQYNRDNIIYNLIKFIGEGVRFKLYKLDISSFYESVDINNIINMLDQNINITRPTFKVISTLLDSFRINGVSGIPRGLSLSAALSEIIMNDFDKQVKQMNNVFFYSRFVDDIVIITSGEEDEVMFKNKLGLILPKPLCFNEAKTHIVIVPDIAKGSSTSPVLDINYLGYHIVVSNPTGSDLKKLPRIVKIDIADKKITKIKTRIIKSCLCFVNDNDFNLLVDRLNSLAGNYCIFDKKTDSKIKTGIYFNYRHVTRTGPNAIEELDAFYKKIILSNVGTVSVKINNKLSKSQRIKLLKITFRKGFDDKVFYHFSYFRLKSIKRCWLYV